MKIFPVLVIIIYKKTFLILFISKKGEFMVNQLITQLSKDLNIPKSLITFTLIASLSSLCFMLFNYSVYIGESVGDLVYILTH